MESGAAPADAAAPSAAPLPTTEARSPPSEIAAGAQSAAQADPSSGPPSRLASRLEGSRPRSHFEGLGGAGSGGIQPGSGGSGGIQPVSLEAPKRWAIHLSQKF